MTQRVRILSGALGVGLLAAAFVSCSPLPGGSLDPVYLKLPGKTAAPEPARAAPPTAPSAASSPVVTGTRVWAGRYRDSRGEGEVTFSLTQSQSMMSGTWRARAGGGGPVIATIEPNGQRWQLRMENSAPECPGTFEGSLEARGATLVGTYRGRDCEGSISDGALELRPK